MQRLRNHVFDTYTNLRIGIAIITGSLPVFLLVLSLMCGNPLGTEGWFLNSMSAYYHHSETARTAFVGVLIATGVVLYLYHGFSDRENWLLNFAGISACLVAVFPMGEVAALAPNASGCELNSGALEWCVWGMRVSAHGISAAVFFVLSAAVIWFCAKDTLDEFEMSPERESFYRQCYSALAVLMLIGPVVVFTLPKLVLPFPAVFFAEMFGIWVFASFWILKTAEMNESRAELHASGRQALDIAE